MKKLALIILISVSGCTLSEDLYIFGYNKNLEEVEFVEADSTFWTETAEQIGTNK